MSEERPDGVHPLIGKRLRDKWLIEAVIGRGGMATVFAATHRNGMRGAIKLLHAGMADTPEVRARFVREGRAANKIDHPGVVKLLDDDVTEDGQLFLVMELLEGKTLRQRWEEQRRRLSLDEAVTIGIEVADILAAAHAAGVVHRDVKPDNVFLLGGVASRVKLLDFGIARMREAQSEATQDGSMLGTPAFMSPEQALARWDEVDHRSDLFSLGATLWTVLSGRLVHAARTVPELLIATATQHAKPVLSVLPELGSELAAILDKALAFDKRSRWQEASEMRDALRAVRPRLVHSKTTPLRAEPASSRKDPLTSFPAAVGDVTEVDSSQGVTKSGGGTIDLAFSRTPQSGPLATLPPLLPPTVNEPAPSRALRRSPGRARWMALSLLVPAVGIAVWQLTRPAESAPPPPDDVAPVAPALVTSGQSTACGALGGACCSDSRCSDPLDSCVAGVCRGSAKRLFGSGERACATHGDGQVSCWGNDPLVGTPPGSRPLRGPLVLPGIRNPEALVLGNSVGLAIVNKRLLGWGKNTYGLLGDSVPPSADIASADAVDLALPGASDVDIGKVHEDVAACAIVNEELRCWGRVAGAVRDKQDPVRVTTRSLDFLKQAGGVPFPLPPIRVGLGGADFACSILRNDLHGEVACWGTNRPWQALERAEGNKELVVSMSNPAPIPSLLTAGTSGACYASDRAIGCWGRVADCGENLAQWRLSHAAGVVTDIAIGGGHHCVVVKGGDLYCLGASGAAFGAGEGSCELRRVPLPDRATAVVAGDGFTCALTQLGAVYCMGAPNGRFGCASGTSGNAPCRVPLTP